MPLLSSPLWMLKPRYDAVIIGSGYGGAVAASRLARARRPDGTPISVCVLERGNEIPTGEFPDEVTSTAKQVTIDAHTHGDIGNGLYHFHVNDEITVLQGCGLGGTSLINANVSLSPEPRVFEDPRWPQAIRDDADGRLAAGFAQATAMLRPVEYHDGEPHGPRKLEAFARAAEPVGRVVRVPINVDLEGGLNPVGIEQKPCTGCGDCVTGCNVGAKNTLPMNYLPDARNHGAEIFCGVAVRSVARRDGGWLVYYAPVGHHREIYGAPELFVRADLVVLGAGSLGSTEILLRSQARGLACSDQLGRHFTGNGDVLGFSYNGNHRVNGVGRGRQQVEPPARPGPTITGLLDLRHAGPPAEAMIIEEGGIPSALKSVLPAAFKLAATLTGEDTRYSLWNELKQWGRQTLSVLTSFAGGAYRGSVANTLTFLAISSDDARGHITLEHDRVRIRWPQAGRQKIWEAVARRYRQLSSTSAADYLPSPLFNKYFDFDLITVHPLGGCALADDAEHGVVNERGLVFDSISGTSTHPGLYVLDGSVIAQPIGVNPLLTISALAERNVRLLVADRGWALDEQLTPGKKAEFDGVRDGPRAVTLQLSERMAGHLTPTSADFAHAVEEARARGHTATAVFGILSPDLDAMIADPDRTARLIGTVHIPALSPEPMVVFDGVFQLFANVSGNRHKQMRYRMGLSTVDGTRYHFEGLKQVKDDRGLDAYADTTELFATVRAGAPDGPIVAKGILKITAEDVLNLVRTLVAHGSDGERSILASLQFGKLFVGDLWDVYGLASKLE